MCLLLLALNKHPVYKLVIAANRDEYYKRPTARAAFWDDHPCLLAGKDLRGGGTWFGVTKSGKIAGITNYREPSSMKTNAPSRGRIVTDFLSGEKGPEEYLEHLAATAGDFNGFNLLVGQKEALYWYSNRTDTIKKCAPGIHGLSNKHLNTPWPKVVQGKESLENILSGRDVLSTDPLFQMLRDKSLPADEHLPDTGVGLEWERILSPVFVASPTYGTRSSTLLFIHHNDRVTFLEKTYVPHRKQERVERFEFQIVQ